MMAEHSPHDPKPAPCPNCGKLEAHFIPPGFGDNGFFACGKSRWQKVIFSADCNDDGFCPVCGDIDFGDCPCPGPTQDGYEYEERLDGLYARWVGDGD